MATIESATIDNLLSKNNGILRLRPAWVARSFLPPGYRIGFAPTKEGFFLNDQQGYISERWIGSGTAADNQFPRENEGLSQIETGDGEFLLLRDVVRQHPEKIFGPDLMQQQRYRRFIQAGNLGYLAKIYDFGDGIFWHTHQRQQDLPEHKFSKFEAYFFPRIEQADLLPGVKAMGDYPFTHFGFKPGLVDSGAAQLFVKWYIGQMLFNAAGIKDKPDPLMEYLIRVELSHLNGFWVPAGTPHAPGTAVTAELQEPSDVFMMHQWRLRSGFVTPESLVTKDMTLEDIKRYGIPELVVRQIDWDVAGDPNFEDNYKTERRLECQQGNSTEHWIYYGPLDPPFSGTIVTVAPGENFIMKNRGPYVAFVWEGSGSINGLPCSGHGPRYIPESERRDEFLVTADAAKDVVVENMRQDRPLEIIKFFGPCINDAIVPCVKKYEDTPEWRAKA